MTDIAQVARDAHAEGYGQGSAAAATAILTFLNQRGMTDAAAQVLAAFEDGTIQALADAVTVEPVEPELPPAPQAPSPIVPAALAQAQAKQQGYTGDMCSNCGSFQMKVSGHCMVCENCGQTTGCS
jgi:ribonucleoside-diphosphate reductase alpha chain